MIHMMKPQKSPQTVVGYIKLFPISQQAKLRQLRELIRAAAPKAMESICYQMPAYKLNGKPLVYFGGFKGHLSIFALPSGIKALAKELALYKKTKSSVHFSYEKPLPQALIRKIVKYRVKEVTEQTKKK